MATPTTKAEPKKNRTVLFIVLGVAAAIIVSGIVALLSSGDDPALSVGTVPASVDGSTPAATGDGVVRGEVWPVTIDGTPLPGLPDSGADPVIGTVAPGLSGFTFDGSPVVVDPSKGPVMLVFLAHWCPHCNREAPEIMQWKADGGVPAELQVIGVTTAVDPTRDKYPPSSWITDEMQWTYPVLADSEASQAFTGMGGSGFPYVVIVGADGTVLDRWSGEIGRDGIQARVDAALA
ncbi:MAG: redoxin domain-containing protein [Ilumatobacteraceae bacterium]